MQSGIGLVTYVSHVLLIFPFLGFLYYFRIHEQLFTANNSNFLQ